MTETIEVVESVKRLCCQVRDLKAISRYSERTPLHLHFCVHCGRHWQHCAKTPEWPHTLSAQQRAEVVESIAAGKPWREANWGSWVYVPVFLPWENKDSTIDLPCGCQISKSAGVKHKNWNCREHQP